MIKIREVNTDKYVQAYNAVPTGIGTWRFSGRGNRRYQVTNCDYVEAKFRISRLPFFKDTPFIQLDP